MAKLPTETTATINRLKQHALDIVDEATAVEMTIFDLLGETQNTIGCLNSMKTASENGASLFSQLSTLQLQIAQSQPAASADMLDLLAIAISRVQLRIPALERSIQEAKMDYNLP
jgi:hypothetical protein